MKTILHRRMILVAYTSLAVLFAIELLTRYDTWIRQVALSVTNLVAFAALIVFGRQLAKRNTAMPWSVAWWVAIGVWFDAAGNFAHLYARFPWWDKLAHAVGSAALAFALVVLLQALQRQGRLHAGKFLFGVFAVSLTTLLSAMYEISEYLGDQWFATHRVTDLFDTADDLLWNLLATVVAVVIAMALRKRSDQGLGDEALTTSIESRH